MNNIKFNENQLNFLTQWLDDLNRDKLIYITDQNDIVIMGGGRNDQTQQIFVNSKDIYNYTQRRKHHTTTINKFQIVSMSDLAEILLIYNYVHESSGQLLFNTHTITLDNNGYQWLLSIIRNVRPNSKSRETQVNLFDGQNTQTISIPYEYMTPTNNSEIVANYLFKNGDIRYDVYNNTYAYRYIEPDILLDDNIKTPERINQHQYLSFYIYHIYIDRQKKRIQLEFRYQPDDYLTLPTSWYHDIASHQFKKDYIIDMLLSNGGIINENKFIFMGKTYSLEQSQLIRTNSDLSLTNSHLKTVYLSSNEKNDLICQYIDLIIDQGGVKYDNYKELVLLENPIDNHRIYFTKEDSLFLEQNQFQRQDVIDILNKYSQIKKDQYDHWLLYYNNQSFLLPSIVLPSMNKRHSFDAEKTFSLNRNNNQIKSFDHYHNLIDYMYRHDLITWDKSSQLIRLHFSDQTLSIPIDDLRSIIDPKILSSSSYQNGILPFTSRQFSQWLINSSYMTRTNY